MLAEPGIEVSRGCLSRQASSAATRVFLLGAVRAWHRGDASRLVSNRRAKSGHPHRDGGVSPRRPDPDRSPEQSASCEMQAPEGLCVNCSSAQDALERLPTEPAEGMPPASPTIAPALDAGKSPAAAAVAPVGDGAGLTADRPRGIWSSPETMAAQDPTQHMTVVDVAAAIGSVGQSQRRAWWRRSGRLKKKICSVSK